MVFQPDVVVVGGGLIGLTCATAVAREGLRVLVVSSSERGAASAVSAGILAPSVGSPQAAVRRLGCTSRDLYPEYVDTLVARTGRPVALDRAGVLEIARDEPEAISLRQRLQGESTWIDASALAGLEPSLAPAQGAALHPLDGAVDAAALLDAVRAEAEQDPRVSFAITKVTRLDLAPARPVAELETGARVEAATIVLAAGAWAGSVGGLPRALPVSPARGQILAFANPGPCHVVMGHRGYLARRDNQTLAGSTVEYVGFDSEPTDDGAEQIRDIARELWPAIGTSSQVAHRAGLRPMTPDLLPIVGKEPDCEGLLYACGHSKNGVLLAPLTAQLIADLVMHGSSSIDFAPYAPHRFAKPVR